MMMRQGLEGLSSSLKVAINCVVLVLAAVNVVAQPASGQDILVPIRKLNSGTAVERQQAVQEIAERAPEAAPAVPFLIRGLTDEDSTVRLLCAYALQAIAPEDSEVIEALVSRLDSADPKDTVEVKAAVIESLGGIGAYATDGKASAAIEQAVTSLIRLIMVDERLRLSATEALAGIGPKARAAVTPLVSELKDRQAHWTLRRSAANALGTVASDGAEDDSDIKRVQGELIGSLETDPSPEVRYAAALALARIKSSVKNDAVISALINTLEAALNDKSFMVSRGCIRALGRMGPNAGGSAQLLTKALDTGEMTTEAAKSLGEIGPAAKLAIPSLITAYKRSRVNRDPDGKIVIANTLGNIAEALQNANDTSAITDLERAQVVLRSDPYGEIQRSADAIQAAIQHLAFNRRLEAVGEWTGNHPIIVSVVSGYSLLLLLWLLLLRVKPRWLLKINDFLDQSVPLKIKPLQSLDLGLSIGSVTLVKLFHYHPRVLDDWVSRHVPAARVRFSQHPTVVERNDYVPIPVVLEGETLVFLNASHLQSTFSRQKALLLISGEGGAGKTSLACQIASWAMAEDKTSICPAHQVPGLKNELIKSGLPT